MPGATKLHREALSLAVRSSDPISRVETLNDLAETLGRAGDAAESFGQHQLALSEAGALALPYEVARALSGIGRALRMKGELDRPRAAWRKALEIFEDLGVPQAEEVRHLLAQVAVGGDEEQDGPSVACVSTSVPQSVRPTDSEAKADL